MTSRRVVVTGLGCVSPLGDSAAALWEGMTTGRSGMQRMDRFRDFPASVFAPITTDTWTYVAELDPELRAKTTRPMHMLFAAVREAMADSGLGKHTGELRIGLIGGTSANYHAEIVGADVNGQPEELLRYYAARDDEQIDWPRFFGQTRYPTNNMFRHMANLATCVPAQHFGLRGVNETIYNACAAGTQAIGAAFHLVKHGHAEVVLAGGSDAMLDWVGVSALGRLGVLSPNPDPASACRPFDSKRSGMVLGEGAGILAVESLDCATRRGAPILAEIVGFGSTCNAYRITDSPIEGKAAAQAIKDAVREAGIEPSAIGAISAHGTSTAQNDVAETNALKLALGRDVATKIPTMAPKAVLGHSLSAAGAIELVAAIRVLQNGVIPGSPSYVNPDPECDLTIVGRTPIERDVRYVLKNSFGFGGQNGSMILKRWEGAP